MNFKNKLIFKIAVALILVVSAGFATFGAGQTVNTILRDYIFRVENCYYERPTPVLPGGEKQIAEPVKRCEIDRNRTKKDLANSFSALLIAGPIAFYSFRNLRKLEDK